MSTKAALGVMIRDPYPADLLTAGPCWAGKNHHPIPTRTLALLCAECLSAFLRRITMFSVASRCWPMKIFAA
eukprot:7313733-Lingulodinium_polyedra.AAC.1